VEREKRRKEGEKKKKNEIDQIKPHKIRNAQHQFNSRTVDLLHRNEIRIDCFAQTIRLTDLSLFSSVSSPFLHASSKTTGVLEERVAACYSALQCVAV